MPHAASARAYHDEANKSDNVPRQHEQPLVNTDPVRTLPGVGICLEEPYRVAFQSIWDKGVSNATLPDSLRKAGEENGMFGPEYKDYWHWTAGAQMRVPEAKSKAMRELRAIEERNMAEGTDEARRVQQEIRQRHENFSRAFGKMHAEMWKSNSQQGSQRNGRTDAQENDGIDAPKETSEHARDVAGDVEGLLADLKKPVSARDRMKSLNDEVVRLQKHWPRALKAIRSASKPTVDAGSDTSVHPTAHANRGERKQLAKLHEGRAAWNEIAAEQRKTIRELASLQATQKTQSNDDRAQKIERAKKLRLLERHRLEQLTKKRDLLLRLQEVEKAEQAAEREKNREEMRARRARENPVELADILDVAAKQAKKTTAGYSLGNMMYGKEGALSTRARPPIAKSHELQSAEASLPEATNHLSAPQRGADEPKAHQPIAPSRPSDALYLDVPESGEIPIDDLLTLNLNADTTRLQFHVYAMEVRLRKSYPRIDAAPFEIGESTNRQTLQTWLKILVSRWQSRSSVWRDADETDLQVKSIMDHMVRDQNLSNEAAERMAKKWREILENRTVRGEEKRGAKEEEKLEVELVDAPKATKHANAIDDVIKSSRDGLSRAEAGDADRLNIYQREQLDFMARRSAFKPKAKTVRKLAMKLAADAFRAKKPEKKEEVVVEKPEEAIDLDEWDVGGMSFLHNDDIVKDEGSAQSEPKTAPRATTKKPGTVMWSPLTRRLYSTSSRPPVDPALVPKSELKTSTSAPELYPAPKTQSLPHLTPTGSAHMVSVSSKAHTVRTAIAVGTVYFSNPIPLSLIKSNSLKKGDVLSVSRIAGIMAAKKCPDLVPLCHPIALTHVGVELEVVSSASNTTSTDSISTNDTNPASNNSNDMGQGAIRIEAKVSCTGPTGVEMEALTSVMGTALSVVDMCKAVDKFQRIGDVRVVLKEGGKSGVWREEGWMSFQNNEE